MDNESKKDYFEAIQKDLTSVCFKKCYNLEKIAVNRSCFETCYNKYIMTMSTVYKSLKEYGYKYQSIYAYKAFPEEEEWFDFIYSNQMSRGGPPSGIFLEVNQVTGKSK